MQRPFSRSKSSRSNGLPQNSKDEGPEGCGKTLPDLLAVPTQDGTNPSLPTSTPREEGG